MRVSAHVIVDHGALVPLDRCARALVLVYEPEDVAEFVECIEIIHVLGVLRVEPERIVYPPLPSNDRWRPGRVGSHRRD